jgi:membrane associated rhomboid family serine protease
MPAVIGLILVLTLLVTVGHWITRNGEWAVLAPQEILRGQVWRLVTWPFLEATPLNLFFGGIMLYQFGGQLAYDWGEGRFLARYLFLTVGAALITVAVATLPPFAGVAHVGMWPVVDALLLLWCLRYPDQQISFWGLFPMTGRTMALLVVGGTVLYALAAGGFGGLVAFTPHFAALFLGWVLSRARFGLPLRRWKLAWRDFRLERQMRRRSRHLKVVRKNGQDEPPRWLN